MRFGAVTLAAAAVMFGTLSAYAQQNGARVAQTLEEMYPKTPKPAPEMKCPPELDIIGFSMDFTEKQNLCMRAGKPFYLVAKQNFRVCHEQLLQCPRERQVDIYVHEGMLVTVLERRNGLLHVAYVSGQSESGWADPKMLEAPSRY